jgi:hypothetical protein
MNSLVATWLNGNDTGRSSLAIVSVMEGGIARAYSYPLDPADLGRCIRLLALAPEYRQRLHEMKTVSPEWAALVDHWKELERLYHSEAASGKARQCYDRMHELLYPEGRITSLK